MGKKYTVRHSAPVWVTTEFSVEVPGGEDPKGFITANLERLTDKAIDSGDYYEWNGDSVECIPSKTRVFDELGNEL